MENIDIPIEFNKIIKDFVNDLQYIQNLLKLCDLYNA